MKKVVEANYEQGTVSLSDLIILPQEREEFIRIGELAENIARVKLLYYPFVAIFNEQEFRDYVKLCNHLHKRSVNGDDFSEKRKGKRYLVLIAGERRIRAITHLANVGCEPCRETYGDCSDGKCLRKHFKNGRIPVFWVKHPTPPDAKLIQASENIHEEVPPAVKADVYSSYWLLEKIKNPNLTVAAFARDVCKPPEMISHAIRYANLPEEVRQAVGAKLILFGHALELAKLQHAGFSESEILRFLGVVLRQNPLWKVDELRRKVMVRIKEVNQPKLLELSAEQEKIGFRKLLAKNVRDGLLASTAYFRRIAFLCEHDLLDCEDSVLKEKEIPPVVRDYLRTLEVACSDIEKVVELLQEKGIPHLEKLLVALRQLQDHDPSKVVAKINGLMDKITTAMP